MLRASLLTQRALMVRAPTATLNGYSATRIVHSTRRFSSATTASSGNVFKSMWTKYQALLVSHPITTKVVTASAIAAAGDIGCQLAIEHNERVDRRRALVFTFLGGVLVPPILHLWYIFLSTRLPGRATPAILKRLALDQLGFAPTFLPIFFSTLLTLEGVPETIPEKLEADWWPTVKANWVVWVPAQLINFRFVPGNLQVLFANVVGLFWNSYLSYVSHLTHKDDSNVAHAADAMVPVSA